MNRIPKKRHLVEYFPKRGLLTIFVSCSFGMPIHQKDANSPKGSDLYSDSILYAL